MTDAPKFVHVSVDDRQWIAWSKEWPEDLRADAKAMVEKYRRIGAGDNDRERAYNAFLAYRALAPADLGGPQHDDPSVSDDATILRFDPAPQLVPASDPAPDWSDL